MAQSGAGQRPGNKSFLEYQVNEGARGGRGLTKLDAALGTPMPGANANVPPPTTDTPPPVAPAAANPPLTMNGPEMIETQPQGLRLMDQDRYYRDMGHLPTAADLAAGTFAKTFRAQQGRAPTKQEVVAHLYRRPDQLDQVSQDFSTGG